MFREILGCSSYREKERDQVWEGLLTPGARYSSRAGFEVQRDKYLSRKKGRKKDDVDWKMNVCDRIPLRLTGRV